MKKINKIFIIILSISFLFAFNTSLFAQKGTVKGIITDSATKEALIGANVFIKGTSIGTSTDFDGHYSIGSITPGTYTLVASYLGYKDAEQEITIVAGKVLEVNLSQSYLAVEGVEVIVTAQAEAQIAAINRQLSAKTIKNVVSAKKIQENPDANAAEAIGRLPGVSIQRNGGEGSKVVVRGLSPKFNKVTIEGVSMASTGSDDRSNDLSMISPYMLEGIELSKAALPDQEADVIGGSVNFVLREAPEKKALDVLAQTGYGGLKNRLGDYKFVVGASSRFLDNKLGVFAQLDVEQRYRDAYDLDISYVHTTSPDTQEEVDVSVGNLFKSDTERKVQRLGGVVVLDYKLPSGKIKLSSFASKINRNVLRRSEVLRPLFVDHFYRLDDSEGSLLVMNNSLRFENTIGGLKIDGGLSYVFSNNDSPKAISFQATELSAFNLKNEAGEDFDITKPPSVVASFAKNNINDAEVSLIAKNTYATNEKGISADLNFTYDLNLSDQFSVQLKAGGKLKKLNKDYDREADRIQV
ncbi:MAG TPA: TonB-dependent receptor, partial [Saprospiraceae bacterium]|nr:TonB-dependent receptor [Saprospiraceae bacterium]